MRKLLGILGGMGPQASASFYETIIKNTKADKDQDHIDMVIYSHSAIPDRTTAIETGNVEEIKKVLGEDLKKLQLFGSDFIAVTCNTSHYFIDDLAKELEIPLVSIVDETVNYLISSGIKKVGIMATDGTVKKKIYEKKLLENDIEVVIPDAENQDIVMDIIYKKIKKGLDFDKEEFNKVGDYLKSMGSEKVILGCTELSYYGEKENLESYYVNPQIILARKCIELCGGKLV